MVQRLGAFTWEKRAAAVGRRQSHYGIMLDGCSLVPQTNEKKGRNTDSMAFARLNGAVCMAQRIA